MSDAPPPLSVRRKPGATHWVALLAAVCTWPLLLVGGTVSVYRFGMAVPDWPTTFNQNMFLYDFWNGPWSVFVEHGHRLYGAVVGFCCIVLAAAFFLFERRTWMKGMGFAALLAVIVQGVLGGLRVRLNSPMFAFVHGCSGQAVFGLLVALCVWTGRDWIGWTVGPVQEADPSHLRRRAAVTLALVYAQIVAGAWVRHFGTTAALMVHATLGLAVWGHAAALAYGVVRRRTGIDGPLAPARRLTGRWP